VIIIPVGVRIIERHGSERFGIQMSLFGTTQTIIHARLFVECIARYRIKEIIFGIGHDGRFIFSSTFGIVRGGTSSTAGMDEFGIVRREIEFGIEWFFFSSGCGRCMYHSPCLAME
jgi:hypothetical protein